MVDSIKITALQDIGANIAYTTLVPLVNMAGTPTTQKANLQNLGNLILNGAGGSYFARAAQANIALSVANAAQPNITSVGNLTSLAVTGNITAGNINGGNIVVANFYYGDGRFLTNVVANSSYSNSNVANYLPTYTGNVGAGNVNVTGTVYTSGISSTGSASLTILNVSTTANLGAVGNVRITGGSAGQKLTTDGAGNLSWTNDANSSYGNSNVVSLMAAFGSNTITTTGNVSVGNIIGNGQALTNIAGANVSGFVPNANVANTAFAVAAANVSGLGNIATINLTGSNANVLYGNGVFAPVSGAGGLPLANGTSNFNIAAANGNATVGVAGEYTWTFGTTGNVTIPGSIVGTTTIEIDNRATGNSADINLYSADDITLQARDRPIGATAEGGDINIFAGDSAEDSDTSAGDVIIEAGAGGASNLDFGGSGGFIRIEAGDGGAASANYSALSGGSLTLNAGDAGGNGGNIALGASGGDVTINAGDSTGNGDPGGDITLNAGLAGANALAGRVQINIPSSANGNGGTWSFAGDGSTIYPNLTVTRGDRTGTLTGQTLLFGDSTQEAIITTPNGTNDINASQRFVINPGAGAANTTGEGGDIYLYAGRGGDLGGSGGDIKIRGGLGPVDGTGGYLDIQGGDTQGNGTGGYIDIRGGESGNAIGGAVNLYGGYGPTVGGNVTITGGQSGTGDGGNVTITGGVGGNGLPTYGNVNIAAGASTWAFGNDGNLILANGNSIVRSVANSSSEPLYPNVSTMVFTPDAFLSSQSLVLDPTGPSHIHLRAPGANIDEPDANIFLGGEASSFEVGYYNGNVPNLYIHSNNNTWTFDTAGTLVFPRDTSNISTDPILNIIGGANPTITSTDASLAGPANLGISALNTIFTGFTGDAIKIYPDDGEISSTANLQIWANSGGNTEYSWTFDTTGNLTLPLGSIVYETNIPDGALSGSAIALKPIGGTTANQQLLIYPTAGDGDHIHLTSGNLYQTELFLGSDNLFVKLANTGNIIINSDDDAGNTAQWKFGIDGNLTASGNLIIAGNTNVFGTDSALIQPTDDKPLIALSSGANGAVSSVWVEDIGNVGSSNIAAVYANPTPGSGIVRIAVGQNGGNAGPRLWDFNASGALTLPQGSQISETANTSVNITANANTWAFGVNGTLTLPGNTFAVNYANGTQVPVGVTQDISSNGAMSIMLYDGNIKYNNYATVEPSTGNIAGGNISATGNISANNFTGNGASLSNVATKTTGSWTLASGNNTVSISVPINGTYSIWVNGNIPNGIITYTATAVVTNTNVPVLGEQYGWFYEAGNALVLTSIPNQFVGTQGAISNASPYSGNTANVFTFGITNNSGANAVVNYGYTKL